MCQFVFFTFIYKSIRYTKYCGTVPFIEKLEEYIHYYNNERISLKLKGMSPVQYRAHSQMI
ncbi:MAG: hypothetical protein E7662_11920 [Ruminococcaceae bacterium]|nr:hypothetical protein [Oscillospiraceae bacterium]